jgi:hypothetical protein
MVRKENFLELLTRRKPKGAVRSNCVAAMMTVIVGLAACAGPLPSEEPYASWRKSGASQAEFRQDRGSCVQGAVQEEGIVATRSPTPRYSVNETLFRKCMESKGWSLNP